MGSEGSPVNENIAARLLRAHRDFDGAEPLVDVRGLSSPRICHLLNQLVREMDAEECYLEIGTWQGLTLLSAALGNFGRTCIGCDKFRFWGRYTGLGLRARRELARNLRRYRGRTADIHFYHTTSQRLFAQARINSPVGVYFYDGDHGYRATRESIVAATPFLSERCILLVDDWNDPVIRQATCHAAREADLRVLWRRDLPGDHSERGWWNGLGAFYLEKGPAAARLERGPLPVPARPSAPRAEAAA